MIRVLQFVSVINRFDFVDTVLTDIDRTKFKASALTVTPPGNRIGDYPEREKYNSRCLNIEFSRLNYWRIFNEINNEIRHFKPHILQVHHYEESVIGALAAKKMKVPAFVIGHHYDDAIHILSKGIKRTAYLGVERICNNLADQIVVPTQQVAEMLIKQGINTKKISKIPYGMDFGFLDTVNQAEVVKIRDEYALKDKFVVLTCGRLSIEKGLVHLLRAIPKLKNRYPFLRMVIVGAGPYENELKKIQGELDLGEVVQFIGHRSDIMNYYSIADVVVQPSLSESFCQVLTESLAAKRPVVMTPVGIAPEVIINNLRGGVLVPIGDSDAIADAISSLIENPNHRQRLAETGYEYVRENMSTEHSALKYEELYERLIEQKNAKISELSN